MTTHVSGGGGGGYPGVTSDGANGLIIQHALKAGNASASVVPDFHVIRGQMVVRDTDANIADADLVFEVKQDAAQTVDGSGTQGFQVTRSGDISASDYFEAAAVINDSTASLQPMIRFYKQGVVTFEIATRKSITGVLSSVTDANAKAVLTSIIAALTGIKVANNNTT